MSAADNAPKGSIVVPADAHFAIAHARFNEAVVSKLVQGAQDCLQQHGVPAERVHAAQVPGAWELPWLARRFAAEGRYAAIVTLGAVIRGDTPHFDYVAGEAARGLMQVMLDTGVIISFGLLTTDTEGQAYDRAGGRAGNKGWDAALTALEMVALAART